jgi:hypothetical protein
VNGKLVHGALDRRGQLELPSADIGPAVFLVEGHGLLLGVVEAVERLPSGVGEQALALASFFSMPERYHPGMDNSILGFLLPSPAAATRFSWKL